MVSRIAGPLGSERGWVHVIEQHSYICNRCKVSINPGRMMACEWKRRHIGCHLRAQVDSMTLEEKEEMLQRIQDLCNEYPETITDGGPYRGES